MPKMPGFAMPYVDDLFRAAATGSVIGGRAMGSYAKRHPAQVTMGVGMGVGLGTYYNQRRKKAGY